MKIEFKGVRKYFSDQEVRSFVVVFDLSKFLQSYPGFSDKLTAEKIVNGASSFNEFADYIDRQSEPSTPEGILYYLMELLNSDNLLLELIPDKSNPGEILDYMDAFPGFDLDFFEEVSEVLPTNLEQYWMIESIKAL